MVTDVFVLCMIASNKRGDLFLGNIDIEKLYWRRRFGGVINMYNYGTN